jgi:Na+-driven multidrug efflux pump
MIYPLATYLLAFKLGLGIEGIWMAKITLEWCILILYLVIIEQTNWHEVAENI